MEIDNQSFLLFLSFLALIITVVYFWEMRRARNSSASSPFHLAVPTGYKHILTVADESASERLTSALNKLKINPTVTRDGSKLQVSFTATAKLNNVEELKSNGLILDYKITETII
jgi:hypothetical protein